MTTTDTQAIAPAKPSIPTADPPASPPPTPDATPEQPATEPAGTFTPTRPARLGKMDWAWEGHPVRTPWVSLSASPDPADVPALKTALDSLSAVPAKALAGMRAEFLSSASGELAGIRAAEQRIADNAREIAEAEAELAKVKEQWKASFFHVTPSTMTKEQRERQKQFETAARDIEAKLNGLKGELPGTLTEAVEEAKAVAGKRLNELLVAKNQVAKAAAEQRQEKARAALAAALAGPLAEWLLASVELGTVHAAGREIPRLSRID